MNMEQLELYVPKTEELFAAQCLRRGESGMYIETPRMIIRGFSPEDAADLHENLGDEKVNHGNWADLYFYGLLEENYREGKQHEKPLY